MRVRVFLTHPKAPLLHGRPGPVGAKKFISSPERSRVRFSVGNKNFGLVAGRGRTGRTGVDGSVGRPHPIATVKKTSQRRGHIRYWAPTFKFNSSTMNSSSIREASGITSSTRAATTPSTRYVPTQHDLNFPFCLGSGSGYRKNKLRCR